MIQRKQSIFLFLLALAGIILMFHPVCTVADPSRGEIPVPLVKLDHPEFKSTTGHQAAIFINFGGLILSSVAIFIYTRRALQLKIAYVLAMLWLILTLMIGFCPFVEDTTGANVPAQVNYLSLIVSILGIVVAIVAARYIKADIELLKSADRIR